MQDLQEILKLHSLWLKFDAKGKRANLRVADLQRADLREADLREADLQEADLRGTNLQRANLDFSSGIPFHCSGTKIIGDERLFSQIVYHLTRQNWSNIPQEYRDWLNSIPEDILNSFLKYRDDLKEM